MYHITIAPLERSGAMPELSYFSKYAFEEGSLVPVQMNKRALIGLVLSCIPVSDAKASIRQAGFSLKKIATTGNSLRITPALMKTAKRAETYYRIPIGVALSHLLPKGLRTHVPHTIQPPTHAMRGERLFLHAPTQERYAEYRHIVRAAFSKKASVFVMVPTLRDAEQVANALTKGIERYLFVLHGGLSNRTCMRRLADIHTLSHPVAIIGTGGFLGISRADMSTIIVERDSSRAYRQQRPPFIDFRIIAEWHSTHMNATLIRGDQPIRVPIMHAYEEGTYQALRDIPSFLPLADATLVDMRLERSKEPRAPFVIVGRALHEALEENHKRGNRSFLFAARRGLAPIVVCGDCNARVSCNTCSAPVVLHHSGAHHFFVCHACGATRSAHETCAACHSWKLQPLGIGIQAVEKYLSTALPHIPLVRLDKDTTPTHTEAKKRVRQYMETEGSILLGTEMALSYLTEPVALCGIVSLDSLLSRAEWNTDEYMFSLVMRLREMSTEHTIVQTRHIDDPVLQYAVRGNVASFYSLALKDRKEYGYPPFATLVKFTARGSEQRVEVAMDDVARRLVGYSFTVLPQRLRTKTGEYVSHGFLRIPAMVTEEKHMSRRKNVASVRTKTESGWPADDITERLQGLPRSIIVEVDPERIL